MKSYSITHIKQLDACVLFQWLKHGSTHLDEPFQVIDVRGSDYVGGHIRTSWNYPYKKLKLDSKYMSTLRNRLLQEHKDKGVINCVFHCAQSQQRGPSSALKFLRTIPQDDLNKFQIWILKGGFNHWQSVYGKDETVTENYEADIWEC